MTLVVKDQSGREMRVKDGVVPAPGNSALLPDTNEDESRSVLNVISFEQLRIGQIIGQGSGGKVRTAQHRVTKKTYALKYVDFEGKSEEARDMLANELRRVEALKHDHIVSSYEAFFRKSRLCVVLEWMDAGSMADVIARHDKDGFPEPLVAFVASGLFKGLSHLHNEKIMHRDIKPANVLANSKGEVKISDFGIAKVFSGSATKTVSVAGSTPYMSPEMITNQAYSFESDVWSAGMTIAECAIGAYPFVKKKADPFEMFETVQKGCASVVWNQRGRTHSDLLKSFVNACLAPKAERPTAEALLSHPFMKCADEVTMEAAGKWLIQGKQTSCEPSSCTE
eukprot:GILI01018264.1.p1 GENE.GILI01018264.1~~GILI01018264.1.p1  ORF type:complete len:374 (+),score=39.00 GILI01018264.1:106-1122(+)